jgi:hypothetical protein
MAVAMPQLHGIIGWLCWYIAVQQESVLNSQLTTSNSSLGDRRSGLSRTDDSQFFMYSPQAIEQIVDGYQRNLPQAAPLS